ncbi:hypothetical protein FV232_23040 [Methylobacterium sp. WL30]|uniref:hypothetical protein n=1 Tax=unclassified Methylobacterium TaxID=2615210 RepID=UPI0011CAEF6D|nr:MULTISPECIES: hypothetical protein [unclassified Methylobacterium]TXN51538.1 hypothetical protein FV227_07075 [Methylobacterium sp. WL119]TXN63542.1 hypothetical protein FV232_23040 [Methylobacterium sp. WL30]
MAVQQSNERRSHARHITMLVTAQEDLRRQLAQQQATTGTLTELQARVAANEQEGKLATQKLVTAREELAALDLRRSELQQRAEEADKMVSAQAQQLVAIQARAQQSSDALATTERDIALVQAQRYQFENDVAKLNAEKLSSISELEAARNKLAETQGQISLAAEGLKAKTEELATLDKLLSVTRQQVTAQKEPTGSAVDQNREGDPETKSAAPVAK